MGEPGDAEIADLDGAVAQPHDVGRFQVPVDDALLVRVGEGRGHLIRDVGDVRHRQRVGAALVQQLAQIPAVEQLHHQVQHAVGLAEVVHDGDSAVLESGGHAGLAPEPFPQHAQERLLLPRAHRFEALDRDAPVQRFIASMPYLSHATAPDEIEQLVAALDQSAFRHRPSLAPVIRLSEAPTVSSMASSTRLAYAK